MKTLRAPAVLLGCLLVGLPIGGLRDPLLWTATAALIWLVAFASPAPSSPSLKLWGLWLAWALLSTLTCGQPLKSLFSFSRWLTLIAYFHVAAEDWREQDSKRWFIGLAVCAAILGAATLLVEGTVHPMTGLLRPYYNYTVFVEAAFFAAALASLGHPDGPRGKARWALWGTMAFVLGLIIKARSRSGLAAIGAAFILWLIRRGKTRWLAWGLLGAAAAAVLAPQNWLEHLLKLDMSSWFTRPQIWTAALRTANDHPFLGEGPGNFLQGFLRHNFPKLWGVNYTFTADHAHSEVLEAAATTGWIGLALFLLACFKSLRPASREAAGPMQEAGLCACAAMAVHCLIDNMLQIPALAMLLFTAALCAQGPSRAAAAPRQGLWRGVCGLGLLLSLASFLPPWLVERAWDRAGKEPDPWRRAAILGQAARLFPADPYVRETLARTWLECRPPQEDRALGELALAGRLDPTNALYPVMEARLALKRGEEPAAVRLLNRALALEPNYLEARRLRAGLWSRAGHGDAARRESRELARRRKLVAGLPLYSAYDREIVRMDDSSGGD